MVVLATRPFLCVTLHQSIFQQNALTHNEIIDLSTKSKVVDAAKLFFKNGDWLCFALGFHFESAYHI